MTDINTFSAAIDEAIVRSGRPDRLNDCVSWARTTMRECQVLAQFSRDMVEDAITATADPYLWTQPATIRQMRSVQYPGLYDPQGSPIYPDHILPGKKQRGKHYFWYETGGDTIVFAGHGGSASGSTTVNVAYLAFFTPLKYYSASEVKPANYTIEDLAWTYTTAVTTAEEEAARALVTNWLLTDWFDMVVEGTLAKLYKTNDDQRSPSTFALYKSFQKDLIRGSARLDMGGNV